MKFIKKIFYLLLFSMIIFPNHFAGDKTKGKLIVKFIGLKSNFGEVKVALCNSSKNYDDHKSPFIGKDILIENKKAVIEFDELPFGEYAVKAFHDEDNNDDLNTNLLGIPIEDYGFSNDARGMFGPPSWYDAKFSFGVEKQTIEIVIK